MDTISAIYEAVQDPEAFDDLPSILATAAAGRSAILELMTPEWDLREASYSYFSPESAQHYIANELYRLGPWRSAALRQHNLGRMLAFEEEVPVETFVNTAYFNEGIRSWGDDTARAIGGVLRLPDAFVKICIHRGISDSPFSSEDAGRLQPLLSHLGRMFRLRSELVGAADRALLTEAALDLQENGVFVVEGKGRVQYMNRAAEALAIRGDGLTLTRVGLRASTDDASKALCRVVAQACAREGGHGGALSAPRRNGPPLRVLVMPLQVAHVTRALVLVNDPALRPRRGPELQTFHGLSPAEAEIADALAAGLAPADIADQRNVTLATVRTQIAQALRKTETTGIPGLVGLVSSSPGLAERACSPPPKIARSRS